MLAFALAICSALLIGALRREAYNLALIAGIIGAFVIGALLWPLMQAAVAH
jgi:hypothetical protein